MNLCIAAVDLKNGPISRAWLDLLDHYAQDPMGGGEGLSEHARSHLVRELRVFTGFHGALAWLAADDGSETPVGLINCFTGFSTFAARPLLNIHDVVVHADYRGRGIGRALLAWAEQRARDLGCCKLTLEVLANNSTALAAYERAGFAPYVLDPAAGQALFLQKLLPEAT
ncbi:N-acetyltransferase [Dechloromonas sp.]|uniref:GNAT family N-acetyltransferase n=1 Tax=Dechloromonas sp. TaxID=1917218 RepID=UPI001227F1C9|nr:GNAT family N-acetyltransferase [Dechloromonas sp.]MBU3697721.1 GNAT family N-acetyltransferase [Dechloromonas sp.]TEX44280.1 MAG: GNAT family N-acetyltransferase [Rhodocyclaceae bacterium]